MTFREFLADKTWLSMLRNGVCHSACQQRRNCKEGIEHEEITHLHPDLELLSFNRNSALGGRANTNYRGTNYF